MTAEVEQLFDQYQSFFYFRNETPRQEIERVGQGLYDPVRQLFDTSNELGIKVRYWQPDVETKNLRPAERGRLIEAKIVFTDTDIVHPPHFNACPAMGYFRPEPRKVFIFLFPESERAGYVYSGGSIELRIGSESSNITYYPGYGGILQPDGMATNAELPPTHLDPRERREWLENKLQETHDAFALFAKAIQERRIS